MAMGCVEFAVPGKTLEDKLRVLESRGMWLELVNDGIDEKRLKDIINVMSSFNVPIKSVQAYLLHDLQMLGGKEKEQEKAVHHVEETIKIASDVGAQNVVTIIAYGKPMIENPREKCVKLFKYFGELGKEFNVIVSIEPLNRKRTTFLPSVPEVYRLVRDVGSEHVQLMADTMHIHSNEENVAMVVSEYFEEIAELQLRDTDSRPPGQGAIDFPTLLKIIREKFRGLTCLEFEPGPNPGSDFDQACKFTADIISVAR